MSRGIVAAFADVFSAKSGYTSNAITSLIFNSPNQKKPAIACYESLPFKIKVIAATFNQLPLTWSQYQIFERRFHNTREFRGEGSIIGLSVAHQFIGHESRVPVTAISDPEINLRSDIVPPVAYDDDGLHIDFWSMRGVKLVSSKFDAVASKISLLNACLFERVCEPPYKSCSDGSYGSAVIFRDLASLPQPDQHNVVRGIILMAGII